MRRPIIPHCRRLGPPICSDYAQGDVSVPIRGNIANFAFYKFELAGPSTGGNFAPILGERTSPVTEQGVLGQIPLSPFQPGDYDFRLAVFDNTGELRASCTVRIIIRERPPTPTPPGGAVGP